MPRKTKRVAIHEEGRDRGKTFELKEMPADQGERWATRAVLAIANAGAKLPEGALDAGGLAGLEITWRNVLVVGMQAMQGLTDAAVRPLLEELKPCITFIPPVHGAPAQPIFPGEDSQVEEIRTWYTLYFEYVQLLVGFSLVGAVSTTGTSPDTSTAS